MGIYATTVSDSGTHFRVSTKQNKVTMEGSHTHLLM